VSIRHGRLGADFWRVFAASTCLCLATGASTPQLARYVHVRLGAPAGVVGLIIGSSSLAAIVLRPWFGRAADRYGRRRVAIIGSAGMISGALVLVGADGIASGTAGRMLLGLTGAAANTSLMAWVVELAPVPQRGRALGIFGVSVWVGLAAGPQIGQLLVAEGGYGMLWLGCGGLGLLSAAVLTLTGSQSAVGRPAVSGASGGGAGGGAGLARLVARPGIASAIAWSGEGTVLAFLTEHLVGRGLPAGGLGGAASVFTVFAVSVIVGRLLLAGVVDRVGAVTAAAVALLVVGAGLAVLAVASTFAVAAAGALLLGLGFAPLYPALALLATAEIPAERRAHGIGIFSAYMDVGIAGGAALGGLVVAWLGTEAALLSVAAAQVIAVVLVLGARPPGDGTETAVPVAPLA
jgi:MFS family permease